VLVDEVAVGYRPADFCLWTKHI